MNENRTRKGKKSRERSAQPSRVRSGTIPKGPEGRGKHNETEKRIRPQELERIKIIYDEVKTELDAVKA